MQIRFIENPLPHLLSFRKWDSTTKKQNIKYMHLYQILLSSWHSKQNLCSNKPISSLKLYTTGWKSTIIFQEWSILEPVQATCHVHCASTTKNNLLHQIRKHKCLSVQNVKCFSHEPVSKVSSIFDSQQLTCTCGCPRKMIQNVYTYIFCCNWQQN